MKKLALIVVASVLACDVSAQSTIKLGFIAAMSGPLGLIGAEQKRGLDLALDQLGNRLGGIPVELALTPAWFPL